MRYVLDTLIRYHYFIMIIIREVTQQGEGVRKLW